MAKIDIRRFTNGGALVFVDVYFDDRLARMLLDTGASNTVLDKAFVEPGPHSAGHTEQVYTATSTTTEAVIKYQVLDSIRIGSDAFKMADITAIDLSEQNRTFAGSGLPAIDGILGNDVLVAHDAVIDIGKGKLKFK